MKTEARAFASADVDANGKATLTVGPTPGFKAVQFTKPAAFQELGGTILSLNVPPAMG